MEWVVITGSSVDEAKDLALDQLGVDEADAEFEVLEEPRTGLFGRTRGDAKVRARVKPSKPRPKQERRPRRNGGGGSGGGGGRNRNRGRGGRGRGTNGGGKGGGKGKGDRDGRSKGAGGESTRQQGGGGGGRNREQGRRGGDGRSSEGTSAPKEKKMTEAMAAPEQGDIVKEFLEGLLDAFGVDGDVEATVLEDEIVEVKANGDDLGLLIGPRGNTLEAVQELARRSLQRQAEDTGDVRVRVDVGGYRERRREALDRFARDAAAKVLDQGTRLALEPMSAADRKVVHDAINDVDGVSTVSEGEDQQRRVVLVPDED